MLQGLPPPVSAYRPGIQNMAPRSNTWQPSRSNTQTPTLKGPVMRHSHLDTEVQATFKQVATSW